MDLEYIYKLLYLFTQYTHVQYTFQLKRYDGRRYYDGTIKVMYGNFNICNSVGKNVVIKKL